LEAQESFPGAQGAVVSCKVLMGPNPRKRNLPRCTRSIGCTNLVESSKLCTRLFSLHKGGETLCTRLGAVRDYSLPKPPAMHPLHPPRSKCTIIHTRVCTKCFFCACAGACAGATVCTNSINRACAPCPRECTHHQIIAPTGSKGSMCTHPFRGTQGHPRGTKKDVHPPTRGDSWGILCTG